MNDTEEQLIEARCNYINFNDDLVNSYLKLLVLMYADDTLVLCGNEKKMKQPLLALYDYYIAWMLKFNWSKTKIIVFSRSIIRADNYVFKFGKDNIDVVTEYKYLFSLL